MLVRDVFDSFATHFGLVHDVTDADCWAQNGSAHVFVGFDFVVVATLGRRSVPNMTGH